jgi:hypothetical protein
MGFSQRPAADLGGGPLSFEAATRCRITGEVFSKLLLRRSGSGSFLPQHFFPLN